ncbi:MAG: hypothetical protein LLG00_05050 [Planctomycetaceae bacterium]|nr:hypothetical protein [Planctomycetaceae bacterium]
MLFILADGSSVSHSVQVPTSGDFWNPANYSWLGGDKFLTLVFAAALLAFVWRALSKWDRHLSRQEKVIKAQFALCTQVHQIGGTANVSDFRECGHDVADVLQDIGDGVGKGEVVKAKLDRVHQKLRNQPAPLPVLAAGGDG